MVVFSHFPWVQGYERQQPIMKYMSAFYNILFVEAPVQRGVNSPSGKLRAINDRLTVLQPQVNDITETGAVLADLMDNKTIDKAWFFGTEYTPVLDSISVNTVVYDCMQDLQKSDGISSEMLEFEEKLLEKADLVFTSGKSLYEAKKHVHTNVYCFPSSVDKIHFAQSLSGMEMPDDISRIRFPVVGYSGVIDDHIDLELINQTAQLLPHVSFVLIGPIKNISTQDLPQQKNIHYLGSKSYEELPVYMRYFSAAMMPFAVSDPAHHLCATKALEFMAAARPIITTPLNEVINHYSKSVHVVDSPERFADTIIKVLEDPFDIPHGQIPYADILAANSWKRSVDGMNELLKLVQNGH